MTSNRSALPAPTGAVEPTHPCIRCGRPGVPADAGLCEQCNPLELSQPSATQMHGIAAVGIIAFVLVLAVAGRAIIAGTGPFGGAVIAVSPATGGLTVTLEISNQGSRAASTSCFVTEAGNAIGGPRQSVQSPLVQPGASVRFTTTLTRFGDEPLGLAVECPSP
jgi:hypothetical protein